MTTTLSQVPVELWLVLGNLVLGGWLALANVPELRADSRLATYCVRAVVLACLLVAGVLVYAFIALVRLADRAPRTGP